MARVVVLVELGILLGFLLGFITLRRPRDGDLIGERPIPRLPFLVGKLAMGFSWGFPFLQAIWVRLDMVPFPGMRRTIASVLLLAGLVFTVTAFLRLGRETTWGLSNDQSGLRTTGVYRISRNPMYVGFYLTTIASLLAVPHWANIACGVVGIAVHHCIVLAEERFLLQQYGAAFTAYRRSVRRYL